MAECPGCAGNQGDGPKRECPQHVRSVKSERAGGIQLAELVVEGYVAAPFCLKGDIEDLARQRDAALAALAATRQEHAEYAEHSAASHVVMEGLVDAAEAERDVALAECARIAENYAAIRRYVRSHLWVAHQVGSNPGWTDDELLDALATPASGAAAGG